MSESSKQTVRNLGLSLTRDARNWRDLRSSNVGYSKLELQRLTGHRMGPAPPVSLLRWDNDLFLLVHLHAHQRFVKALNDFTRSQHDHQRVVVAGRIVQSRALGFFFHRRVEDLSAWEFSDVVDGYGVSF